jgi:voltage-gated potassium channel
MAEAWRMFIYGVCLLVVVLIVGTLGFHYFEGHSFLLDLYMTVVTIFTVGFGDFYPKTNQGRIFAIFIIIMGFCAITYFVASVVTLLNEGHITKLMRRRKMEAKLAELSDHIIVCGCGRVGQQVVKVLRRNRARVVAIDIQAAELAKIKPFVSQGDCFALEGDATEDHLLELAGIARARGVIITIADDAYSLLTAMTCHGLNPKIELIARAEREENEAKLLRAGVSQVVSPAKISGSGMALSMIKPASVQYLERLKHGQGVDFSIEELTVREGSALVGQSIAKARLRDRFEALVMAIQRGGIVIASPSSQETIQLGDVLIVYGKKSQMPELEKLAQSGVE